MSSLSPFLCNSLSLIHLYAWVCLCELSSLFSLIFSLYPPVRFLFSIHMCVPSSFSHPHSTLLSQSFQCLFSPILLSYRSQPVAGYPSISYWFHSITAKACLSCFFAHCTHLLQNYPRDSTFLARPVSAMFRHNSLSKRFLSRFPVIERVLGLDDLQSPTIEIPALSALSALTPEFDDTKPFILRGLTLGILSR